MFGVKEVEIPIKRPIRTQDLNLYDFTVDCKARREKVTKKIFLRIFNFEKDNLVCILIQKKIYDIKENLLVLVMYMSTKKLIF